MIENLTYMIYRAAGCVSDGTSATDEVALEGNPGAVNTDYPNFTDIKGVITSQSFNDLTSSISCSPL